MNSGLIGIISVCFGLLIGVTSILLSFIKKHQINNIKKLKQEKKILRMEIEKEKITLKKMEEENKKYDHEIKHLEDTGH